MKVAAPSKNTSGPIVSRERTRVCVVGTCDGLVELVHALSGHDDVDVLGTADGVAEAAALLESGDVQVVVLATAGRPDWAGELTAIREHTAAPIVLLSSSRSGALLEEALAEGAEDALLLPQLVENVAFAVRKASHSGGRVPVGAPVVGEGKVVTVFSPKGGTGKTVIATNLATIFAKELRKRTLLIDLDLQFGDTGIMLGLEPEKTLLDLVSAHGDLDAEKLAGYTTTHECGLDVLPAPLRPQEADLVADGKLTKLLEVASSSYEVVVIDTVPFLHGPILIALDQTSDLLLVSSPEVPTLKDVHLCLHTLTLLSFPEEKVRLVVNRAHVNDGLTRAEVEEALDVRVAWEVPNDRVVSTAVNRGTPAVLLDSKAEFTNALRGMAASLLSLRVPREQHTSRSWLAPLTRARR